MHNKVLSLWYAHELLSCRIKNYSKEIYRCSIALCDPNYILVGLALDSDELDEDWILIKSEIYIYNKIRRRFKIMHPFSRDGIPPAFINVG